jgi:hypothetical protein
MDFALPAILSQLPASAEVARMAGTGVYFLGCWHGSASETAVAWFTVVDIRETGE